jgi:AI-2E family transporter
MVQGSIDRDESIVFSLDDRTGNVLTTAALFMAAAAIVYLARGAFFVLLLSLLLAYLLDPAVTFVQRHSRLGRNNRVWAIAQVYLIGTLVLGGLGYQFGQRLAAQARNLNASLRNILETFPSGKAGDGPGSVRGLSAAQKLRIQDFLAGHHDSITHLLDRVAASAAHFAANAVWLFAVPILAIFLLRDGREMAGAMIAAAESRGDQTLVRRTLQRIDTMLAKYIRAQLALAGLSFLFYSVSLLVLGFPSAIALGFLGGVLEKDVSGLKSSTPIVVFAHIPLWSVYPQWGWGTDDSEQALCYLKRFGSVTVLNGHIHQTMQKVEGNITFHTACSTAFPQPQPGMAASPGPMKVPAEKLRSVLGITDVNFVRGKHTLGITDSSLA